MDTLDNRTNPAAETNAAASSPLRAGSGASGRKAMQHQRRTSPQTSSRTPGAPLLSAPQKKRGALLRCGSAPPSTMTVSRQPPQSPGTWQGVAWGDRMNGSRRRSSLSISSPETSTVVASPEATPHIPAGGADSPTLPTTLAVPAAQRGGRDNNEREGGEALSSASEQPCYANCRDAPGANTPSAQAATSSSPKLSRGPLEVDEVLRMLLHQIENGAVVLLDSADTPDDLVCGICLAVCYQPLATACGHLFCRRCLQASMAWRKECPLDRTAITCESSIHADVRAERQIGSLPCRCPASVPWEIQQQWEVDRRRDELDSATEGMPATNSVALQKSPSSTVQLPPPRCMWVGCVSDAVKHTEQCPHVAVSCPFSAHGCPIVLPRSEMTAHVANSTVEHLLLVSAALQERTQCCIELQAEVDVLRQRCPFGSPSSSTDVVLQSSNTEGHNEGFSLEAYRHGGDRRMSQMGIAAHHPVPFPAQPSLQSPPSQSGITTAPAMMQPIPSYFASEPLRVREDGSGRCDRFIWVLTRFSERRGQYYSRSFTSRGMKWRLGSGLSDGTQSGVFLFADGHSRRMAFRLIMYNADPALDIVHFVDDWHEDFAGKGWGPLGFILHTRVQEGGYLTRGCLRVGVEMVGEPF